MMPGDSQSNKVAIAADATIGNCQNCSVLHQSLSEYVASLLALKQKIKASDDSVRLQQQLEELQIKLVTLEKKTADYESVQAELEEKKDTLKAYSQMSEELDKLRQENSKTTAEKEKLEEQLRDVKELTETQSLENAQLRREKAMIENDLLKTQASLKKSQAQADQVEKLNAENTKIINIKNDLENKIKMLKDSACKQNIQIAQLTKEKILQERNIDDLKVRLIRLERERNKDHRSASTQANTPKEPKVDKEKFRMLLENLWACVEPQQSNSENCLLLPGPCTKQFPPSSPRNSLHCHLSKTLPPATPKIRKSLSHLMQSNATCTQLKPADEPTPIKHQAHLQSRATKKQIDSPKKSKRLSKDHKTEESSADLFSSEVSFEEIRALFKPMAPCISPIADLETEIESMETDGGEKEHQPKPAEEESLLNTTSESSHCPKSAAPAEENMDLPVSASQVMKDISSGNDSQDLGQKELSGITETEDKSSADVEEIHAEQDLQIELKPETEGGASSSPSTSDVKDLVEAESLPPESQEPTCSINPDSSCETEKATPNKKEDQLESVSKMEVDVSPCNDKFGETVTAEVSETPSSIDTAVTSEQAGVLQPVSSSPNSLASTGTTGDAEQKNTEKSSEINSHEESHDFGQDSQTATVSVPQETDECLGQDTDVPEEKPCASISSDSVSNENAGERLERKVCVTPSEEEQSIKVEQCEVKKAESSLESNRDDIKSSQLKMEEEEVSPGSKSSQENLKTPSKKDVDKEALESSCPDSPQQEAINCKSLEDKTHLYCRRLSPTCLFPTIKLLSLETNPTPKKLNFSDNVELTSSSKEPPQPVPSLEEEGVIEKGEVKDSPSDSKQPSKRRGRKCKSVSPAALSKQGAAAKKEQNKCTVSSRNQSLHMDREEEPRLVKGSAKAPPEFIGQVRFEMGPPLPRLLTPLSTPPKAGKLISPRHAIGRLSFPSPLDRLTSPSTPTQANLTPTSQQPGSTSLNSPVHPTGVPSSPLQFGSATPKHAVPVPGRLPATAVNSSPSSSSSSPSQENSVRMLDTMYPELSAHARTLSILRGNVSLGICSPGSGTSSSTSISQMSSFKTVNSTSTAFTKTETRGEKRQSTSLPEPNNGKRSKIDDCSPAVSCTQVPSSSPNSGEGTASPQPLRLNQLPRESHSPAVKDGEHGGEDPLVSALKRIEDQCFDLLPVVRSHQYVGSIPKKPILRDEEKDVIYEICQNSGQKADEMLSAILHKLKAERRDLNSNHMQALCRVYTGICRRRGDWEKVRILAYSILTEDFHDPAKLILFMVTTWPNVLSHKSSLCEAIHAVTKAKAQENLLSCLSAFLGWEKTPPCDIDELISRTLSNMKSGSPQPFAKHSRYGYNPGVESWEHIYTLHLLCTHKKWKWTYDNILGKELWPLMNTWVAQPRDQQAPISDTTVATVLRLIGLLGQLGIAERCASSVVTVANVINTFGSHGPTEGVPWEVQLAAVYCIYDLSPCNPKQALGALAEWRGETSQSVPPAVTSCINQLASVCRQVKN